MAFQEVALAISGLHSTSLLRSTDMHCRSVISTNKAQHICCTLQVQQPGNPFTHAMLGCWMLPICKVQHVVHSQKSTCSTDGCGVSTCLCCSALLLQYAMQRSKVYCCTCPDPCPLMCVWSDYWLGWVCCAPEASLELAW